MTTTMITLPRNVVESALFKAKVEYDLQQPDAGPRECWSEFENLAEAAGVRFSGLGVLVHVRETVA